MEINELLKGVNCSCGRHHSCDIGFVAIEDGAIAHLVPLTKEYRTVLLVADENTWAAAGAQTEAALEGKQVRRVIFPGSTVLIPNEEAIDRVNAHMDGITLIIGIGSGVIQDLCKYVSLKSGVPYFVVATAPSMDGYASTGAAMILGGMKVTVPAGVPKAILADPQILKNAPMDMIRAGYGDIVGKYSALNDWLLSRIVNDEYFCQEIYDLTFEMVQKTLALAEGLQQRDGESVKVLMEALVTVGIAMSFAGSSRPASGSEHHLSHFFEITGIVHGEEYFPHGVDVAYSTVITARLREQLLQDAWTGVQFRPKREHYVREMSRIYGPVAAGCIALQDKVGLYEKDMLSVYKAKEAQLREVLAQMPAASDIEGMLAAVGLDMKEFYQLYSAEKIADAVLYAKELKDRYTVLWMHYDLFGGVNMGFPYKHKMTVAAHRGDRYNSFENTMEAFEAARLQGADMIETDVRMTADGHLVLIHDPDTLRTTGEFGLIREMTLEEVRTRNAGNELHPLQIPTLEELLCWALPYDLLLNIEFKEYYTPGNEERCKNCVDKVVALVQKYGLEDRVVLNCFDAWPLEYADEAYHHRFLLHGFYPYSRMHNVSRDPDEYLYCACIWGSNIRKEYYEHLLKHGVEPWVGSSVTSSSMLEQVCQYGAKLITTDNAADIISKLERLGMRA